MSLKSKLKKLCPLKGSKGKKLLTIAGVAAIGYIIYDKSVRRYSGGVARQV